MTPTLPKMRWMRAKERCPICGHAAWCGVTADGTRVLCRRDASDCPARKGTGWWHDLSTDAKPSIPTFGRPKDDQAFIDFPEIMRRYRLDTVTPRIASFADDLGVSREALRALDACWSSNHDAWAFPMRDGRRNIIGVRLRNAKGEKWAIKGSRSGIFTPAAMIHGGPVMICEGPTDAAALIHIGMDAIGRPDCNGGVDYIIELLRGVKRDVVIMADRDGPGLAGAETLANRIYRPTRIVSPPRHKDIRAWVCAGASIASVMAVISATRYHRSPNA